MNYLRTTTHHIHDKELRAPTNLCHRLEKKNMRWWKTTQNHLSHFPYRTFNTQQSTKDHKNVLNLEYKKCFKANNVQLSLIITLLSKVWWYTLNIKICAQGHVNTRPATSLSDEMMYSYAQFQLAPYGKEPSGEWLLKDPTHWYFGEIVRGMLYVGKN